MPYTFIPLKDGSPAKGPHEFDSPSFVFGPYKTIKELEEELECIAPQYGKKKKRFLILPTGEVRTITMPIKNPKLSRDEMLRRLIKPSAHEKYGIAVSPSNLKNKNRSR